MAERKRATRAKKRERTGLYLACGRGLSPRQIQQTYPTRFPAIGEIYQTKRNVLARLRRRPELCSATG